MPNFDYEPERVPASRGIMRWSIKVVPDKDNPGSYVYMGNGSVDYLDENGSVIPEAGLQGNLMDVLTNPEKLALKDMLDRVAALADSRALPE